MKKQTFYSKIFLIGMLSKESINNLKKTVEYMRIVFANKMVCHCTLSVLFNDRHG
jgi:hypothetical protein